MSPRAGRLKLANTRHPRPIPLTASLRRPCSPPASRSRITPSPPDGHPSHTSAGDDRDLRAHHVASPPDTYPSTRTGSGGRGSPGQHSLRGAVGYGLSSHAPPGSVAEEEGPTAAGAAGAGPTAHMSPATSEEEPRSSPSASTSTSPAVSLGASMERSLDYKVREKRVSTSTALCTTGNRRLDSVPTDDLIVVVVLTTPNYWMFICIPPAYTDSPHTLRRYRSAPWIRAEQTTACGSP